MALENDSILVSLLDNDFYKFTMQNCVVKLFPRAKVRYEFINRGKHNFPDGFSVALRKAVDSMTGLKLTKEEKLYLSASCPYLDPTYLDFLQGYCYEPGEVEIVQEDEQLRVTIEGLWYRTILWEVPIMSLISELFYKLNKNSLWDPDMIVDSIQNKINDYDELGVTVADFGSRRRHSYGVHKLVVKTLKERSVRSFVGTSNVHLAMINKSKPIGTHAHEWFMFHAAKYGYRMANLKALENWVTIYKGDLGIALSDTFTTKSFFQHFDKMFAKLFDGVRQDSGNPLHFADATIEHYNKNGIDPLSKTIIFSDSLNYNKVAKIANHCAGKIGFSFGIGTNFTNDVGVRPMNMVIKMISAAPDGDDWAPVVKLSDEAGKNTGDEFSIKLARMALGIA